MAITSNFFKPNDTERLWAYLDSAQKDMAIYDSFVSALPNRKEIQALAILLIEALRYRGYQHLIPLMYFDVKDPKQPADGVFRVPNYDCLTEDFKEYPLAQTLTQDLTELAEWMID